MRLNVSVKGLDEAINGLSRRAIGARTKSDRVTETYTRKMANEAGEGAPVEFGDLRANLLASPHRLAPGSWQFGGTLAYTRRQEYEHKTKRGFIRKAVWNNREDYRNALRREVLDD